MSDSDSFIEEVTEEVRKDQLYGYLKKYGWIAGALIILIVGGAAYSEWSKSKAAAAAQARGDAIAASLNNATASEQVAALQELSADAGDAAILIEFQKAAILANEGQTDAALTALDTIANAQTTRQIYRDMASFKALILRGNNMDRDQRMSVLQALSTPGNPFRPLALEQIAVAKMDAGDKAGAIDQFSQLLNEPGISPSMQQRALQLIVSLGGEIPEVTQLLSGSETAQ